MSVQHQAVRAYLAVTGAGRPWRSAEALDRAIARRRERPTNRPKPSPGVSVTRTEDDGWTIVRLVPPRPAGSVVALHGGAYLFGPESQHWALWRTIAVASSRTVVVPLYRRAPEGTAAETVPRVTEIVRRLAEEGPVAMLGDSAGGGMALAAAQLLAVDGLQPPLLLSAPWLDGAVPAPWTTPRDHWLGAPGLRRAAELYRGELPVEHPFVSPIKGDLRGLGPIVAASGTRDVLHRDTLWLEERCPSPVQVLTGEGLLHNYPLLPIPEARPVLRAWVDALR